MLMIGLARARFAVGRSAFGYEVRRASHTRMKSAASCMSFESALTRESRIQLSCAIRLFQQLGTNVKYCY